MRVFMRPAVSWKSVYWGGIWLRAVVQRVTSARVLVKGAEVGKIDNGLVVLLGVKKGDTGSAASYLADKVCNLRIFEDEEGKMNLSLLEVGGKMLVVSQFTLYGDARKGRRPGFSDAAVAEEAAPLLDTFIRELKEKGVGVETGVFGATMLVEIHNHGPCTILLDSERIF